MPTPQQLIGEDPQRVADRLQLMLSYLLTAPRDAAVLPISAGTALEGKTRAGTSYTQRFLSDLGSNARRFERDVPLLGPLAGWGERNLAGPARERLQPSMLEELLLGMAIPGGPRRPKGSTEKLLKEMEGILAPRNPKLPVYQMEQDMAERAAADITEEEYRRAAEIATRTNSFRGLERLSTYRDQLTHGPISVELIDGVRALTPDDATALWGDLDVRGQRRLENLMNLSPERFRAMRRGGAQDLSEEQIQRAADALRERYTPEELRGILEGRAPNPRATGQPEPPSGSIPAAGTRRRTSQQREARALRRSIAHRELPDHDLLYILNQMEEPEFEALIGTMSSEDAAYLHRLISERLRRE